LIRYTITIYSVTEIYVFVLSKEQLKDSSEPLGKTFARTIRIPLPNIWFIYGSYQLLLLY